MTDQGAPDPTETPPPDTGEGEETEIQDPKATAELNAKYRRENKGLRSENKRLTDALSQAEEARMSDTEKAISAARKEEQDKFQRELLRERVMGRAASKLTDPEDAGRYLDLDGLTLDNDAIDQAIGELIQARPYLAVQPPPQRTPTTIDQGNRGPSIVPDDASDWLRKQARR